MTDATGVLFRAPVACRVLLWLLQCCFTRAVSSLHADEEKQFGEKDTTNVSEAWRWAMLEAFPG